MALGSTQPLVKMSTRNISWGQRRPVREADNLTTFMCRLSWKSVGLTLLEPSGPHRDCYGTALPLHIHIYVLTLNQMLGWLLNKDMDVIRKEAVVAFLT